MAKSPQWSSPAFHERPGKAVSLVSSDLVNDAQSFNVIIVSPCDHKLKLDEWHTRITDVQGKDEDDQRTKFTKIVEVWRNLGLPSTH